MLAHRTQHSQRQFRTPPEQRKHLIFRDEQHGRIFDRAGVGGVSTVAGQGRFGKRLTGAEDVNDLLFSKLADAVHIDGPALNNVESLRSSALMEKVFAFRELPRDSEGGDGFQITCWNAGEKLGGAQRVRRDDRM